jgi:hypothetical protein
MADEDNKETRYFTMVFKETEHSHDTQTDKEDINNILEIRFGTQISKSCRNVPRATGAAETVPNHFNQYNSPGENHTAFDSLSED